MRRKIYDKLVEWKNYSLGTTALLIEGAKGVEKVILRKSLPKKNTKVTF